jgi:hypothetical protein
LSIFAKKIPLYRPKLVLAFIILLQYVTKAQGVSSFMGSRSYALGNSTVCVNDEWSIFNNVAGLTSVSESTASFSCLSRPNLKAANKSAFAFATPFKSGALGLGVFHFGDNLYNENVATIGYAHKLGITSVGVKLNYIQFSAESYGAKGVVSGSLGVVTQLTPKLSIGAHIVNITQPRISSSENEKLSSILAAGVGIKASKSVFVTSELEKSITQKTILKVGLEYKFQQKFFFRTAFTTNPDAGYFGIGFQPTKLKFDYAFRFEPNVGSGHQATISYRFLKNRSS